MVTKAVSVFGLFLSAVLLVACGGGSMDTPGAVDISSGKHHINIVAYSVPKFGFDKIFQAYRKTEGGSDTGFSASYGASGDQSRKVARRIPAGVVNFSLEPDIARLVKAGVVEENWKKQAPNNSVPFGSVVALVVRKGNPKNIHNWDDLLKPGVEVITPDPGSSGSAKWNLLAPYAAKAFSGNEFNASRGLAFINALVRNHIKVAPSSSRQATTAFTHGQGDVLLSYENEAIMLNKKNKLVAADKQTEYLVPETTFKIENPVAVVKNNDDETAARKFVNYLFTPAAQRIWAEAGFRPVDEQILLETKKLFPGTITTLWTIRDLGEQLGKGTAAKNNGKELTGWTAVDKALFGTSGAITKIYESGS